MPEHTFQTLASADQKLQQTTQGCPFSKAAFLLHVTVLPQPSLSGNPLELHNIHFSIITLYMSLAITTALYRHHTAGHTGEHTAGPLWPWTQH